MERINGQTVKLVVVVLLMVIPLHKLRAQIDKELKANYVSTWSKLIPTHIKLQYAGDMGTLSLGPGWDYGKRKQWETNTYLGFINESGASPTHITFTLKQTYKPFKIGIGEHFSIEPITAGVYMNKIFGQYFWQKWPDRYPKNYYFWALNTRFNVFVGQTYTVKFKKYLLGDSLTLFYEFNTNDLYIISAINNRYLGLLDIINLSFGAKFTFL